MYFLKTKILKNIIPIMWITVGVLSIVFAFICLGYYYGYANIYISSNSVGYVYHEKYGGDAYTGIQNAAADTANNISYLGRTLEGFEGLNGMFDCGMEFFTNATFFILLITGLILVLIGISRFNFKTTANTPRTSPITTTYKEISTSQPVENNTTNNTDDLPLI